MADVVGKHVDVYWEEDFTWFRGKVEQFQPDRGWRVLYEDGQEEWITDREEMKLAITEESNEVDYQDDEDHIDLSPNMQPFPGPCVDSNADNEPDLSPDATYKANRPTYYHDLLHKDVHVFWEGDDAWFEGYVDEYDPHIGWHVIYKDGEEEWVDSELVLRLATQETLQADTECYMESQVDAQNSSPATLEAVQTSAKTITEFEMGTNEDDELFAMISPNTAVIYMLTTSVQGLAYISEPTANLHARYLFAEVPDAIEGVRYQNFRCKTLLHTTMPGHLTELEGGLGLGLEFDKEDATHTFELLLQDEQTLEQCLNGDVTFGLYRMRDIGNEVVGSVCVPLKHVIHQGSVYTRNGCTRRQISNWLPLLNRHGAELHSDVRMYCEVRVYLRLVPQRNEPEPKTLKRYATEDKSETRTARRTFLSSRNTNTKPSSLSEWFQRSRTLKRRQAQAQIEYRNKQLVQKLESVKSTVKHNANTVAASRKSNEQTAYHAPVFVDGPNKPTKKKTFSQAATTESAEAQDIVARVWALKKAVADLEREVRPVRAKVNMLETQCKRYKQTLLKLRSNTKMPALPPTDVEPDDQSEMLEQYSYDPEYMRIKDTHDVLQRSRRALVSRIQCAKGQYEVSKISIETISEGLVRAQRRMQVAACTDKLKIGHEDVQYQKLLKQNRQLRVGLYIMQSGLKEEDPEQTTLRALEAKCLKLYEQKLESLEAAKYERDLWKERYQAYESSGIFMAWREHVNSLKGALARAKLALVLERYSAQRSELERRYAHRLPRGFN